MEGDQMRVTFDTKYFAERLALINKTLGKAIIPVLEGVLVEAYADFSSTLWMRGTDLETSVETIITANIEKPGIAVLPRKILAEMARTWPKDEVTLEVNEQELWAVLTCGETQLELSTYDPDQFPQFPAPSDGAIYYSVSVDVVARIVKQVAVAAAKEYRALDVFTGLLWEDQGDGHVSVVATDTYRMAWMEMDVERNEGQAVRAIIPAQAISTVAALDANVACELFESHVKFTSQQASITARLIGGTYPDWRQVVAKEFATEVRCASSELIRAIEQAALLARQETNKAKANLVRLGFAGNEIAVFAEASGLGTLSNIVPAEKTGKDVSLMFNVSYLLDGLKIYKGHDMRMRISSDEMQMIIEPADEDGTHYLVLPARGD
jgi:DNA polymerase-3 subunit beta